MALVTWDDKYNTGIKDIDTQHQGMVDTMNELSDGMRKGKEKEILTTIADKLVKYSEVHFFDEELYMKSNKFPGLEEHIVQHKAFIKKVHEFRDKFNLQSYFTSLEIMDFLKKWFMNHILETDMEYTSFLKKKGLV